MIALDLDVRNLDARVRLGLSGQEPVNIREKWRELATVGEKAHTRSMPRNMGFFGSQGSPSPLQLGWRGVGGFEAC